MEVNYININASYMNSVKRHEYVQNTVNTQFSTHNEESPYERLSLSTYIQWSRHFNGKKAMISGSVTVQLLHNIVQNRTLQPTTFPVILIWSFLVIQTAPSQST